MSSHQNAMYPYDVGIFQMLKGLIDECFFVDTYENAFQVNAKAHEGKIILPMISVYRLGDFNIATDMLNDQATRLGYSRMTQGRAEFSNQMVRVHSLPVTLQYQIDVWATRRDVCDGIAAELMIEFREHPHFTVNIPDLGDEKHPIEFDFQIDDNVADNTSITDFGDSGRFYRLTLTGNVPSALITRVDTFHRIDYVEIETKVSQDSLGNKIYIISDDEDTEVIEDEVDHYAPES